MRSRVRESFCRLIAFFLCKFFCWSKKELRSHQGHDLQEFGIAQLTVGHRFDLHCDAACLRLSPAILTGSPALALAANKDFIAASGTDCHSGKAEETELSLERSYSFPYRNWFAGVFLMRQWTTHYLACPFRLCARSTMVRQNTTCKPEAKTLTEPAWWPPETETPQKQALSQQTGTICCRDSKLQTTQGPSDPPCP